MGWFLSQTIIFITTQHTASATFEYSLCAAGNIKISMQIHNGFISLDYPIQDNCHGEPQIGNVTKLDSTDVTKLSAPPPYL
jgi:hypothetical protein